MPRRITLPDNFHCVCGDSKCTVPFGYCHCGCGEKTPICRFGRKNRPGNYYGMPMQYLRSHYRIRPVLEDAVPFKIDGVYCRLVPLTQGYYTIVNAEDYDWIMQWKWFAWKNKKNNIYAARAIRRPGNQHPYMLGMHVAILLPERGKHVDHISGIGLDNRRSNLRECTQGQNCMNARLYSSNTTGFKGVGREGKYFIAKIYINGKQISLGRRKTAEEAAELYKDAARKHYGEFARFT